MKKNIIYLILLITAFGFNLCLASPADDYSFVREFGEAGSSPDQFYSIDGIAVDRFGHVFITDVYYEDYPENNTGAGAEGSFRVKRWSTDGVFQLSWQDSLESYGTALGIDCSCDGDPFYVLPSQYGSYANIEHTKNDGVLLETFPDSSWNLGYPFEFIDVAISADGFAFGTVIITEVGAGSTTHSVAKFKWTGSNWVDVVTIDVSNEYGNARNVHGIDVDPWRNRVYVTILGDEGAAPAVNVYDMDLNFITSLALWDYDAQPLGVAVDNRNGAFLICDATSNIIQKFTSDGELLTQWGGYGSAQSQFDYPTDLDVDMNGHVYVADSGNSRVQVFAPPQDGNLNFIVYKSKAIVKWKTKTKGKNRDVVFAKGMVAVDTLTNIFSGPGSSALKNLPMSFWYGELPVISNMSPTKTNKKGSRALYKPDKDHKAVLVYKEKGALIKFMVKMKKADINKTLGINDVAALPPWLWVKAQMTLSTDYLGVHYMRLEHKNKVGKVYKAIKK